ncbi:transglycosylase family protein [Streptomyces gilvosporeus]|uniref:transglycosylase family protein n=1 Tax=Streptomyces gilvosporeus TaxID=553510 RepID=UPI003001F13C
MTASGMALPLFAASGAQAADATTWDRVAQCESGGMWSANSGNGFYGGLQLTQEMWDHYGGSAYAERPDLASRAEQIAVAESLLHDRGPDTWPSCAVNAGLTQHGHAPDVDPGSTPTPRPEPTGRGDDSGDQGGPSADPSDGGATDGQSADPSADPSGDASADPSHGGADEGQSGDPSDGPSADPSGDPSGAPSTDPSDGASDGATPSPSAPDTTDPSHPAGDGSRTDGPDSPEPNPAKGRHRRDTDPGQDGKGKGEDGKGDSGTGRPGRHASRGGDAHRTGPGGGHRADPSAPADGYTVRSGDTLSGIAEAHHLSGGWPALYDRNEKAVGADPDLIHPGQLLDLGHAAG